MKKRRALVCLIIFLFMLTFCIADSSLASSAKEISVAFGADPITMDPRKTFVGPGYSINAHVFEPLVFREETDDGEINIVGVLAESWENVDAKTWEFKLREGIKFHNGKPFNSEAVKFTIDTIMEPEFITSLKVWVDDIEEVIAKSKYVVVVKTKTPSPGLISSLCQIPIVEPGAAIEMGSEFNIKPVGTGPYKIDSYIPNNQVVVSRFDGYWGRKGTYDKITFRIVPISSVRLAALQSEEVMLAEAIPPDKMAVVNSDPNLYMVTSRTMRVMFLNLEQRNPWLAKKEVRHAISYAIDRQLLVDSLLGGTTIVANSVSPPGTIGYNSSLPPYEYNLEKAKQLLEEAGYDGTVLKFGSCQGRYNMDKQVSEAIAAMLTKAGLNISFEAVDWSTYLPFTDDDKYDIWFLGQTDFTLNPSTHWFGKFTPNNDIDYYNPEVFELIAQASQEMDEATRAKIFWKVQEILYDDMPIVPLYYEPQLIGVNKKLKGFKPRLDEYIIVGFTTVE